MNVMKDAFLRLTQSRTAFLRFAYLNILAILMIPVVAGAQTQSVARRDQAAVTMVNKAIGAMGGAAVWSSVTDATMTGNCTASSEQGGASSNFRWISKGKEFRYETDADNSGPLFLSVHGRPSLTTTSGNILLSTEYFGLMRPYRIPGLVLDTILSDASFEVLSVGNEMLDEKPVEHVLVLKTFGFARIRGDQQDWWFDPATNLPIRVEYNLPTQVDGIYVHMREDFNGWSTLGKILAPQQTIQSTTDGLALQSCTLDGVTFNTNPEAALFEGR